MYLFNHVQTINTPLSWIMPQITIYTFIPSPLAEEKIYQFSCREAQVLTIIH